MIRTALDSENINAFTTNVDFILTYTDLITDPSAFEAKFPGQQVVYIDRALGDPGLKATVIDIEPGAFTPVQVVDWFEERFRRGVRWLTHYSDRNDLPVIRGFLAGRVMWEWVATLDGTAHINGYVPLRGPDLVQVLDAGHLGFNADFSLVLNPLWRPSPRPDKFGAVLNSLEMAARTMTSSQAELSQAITTLRTLG